MAMALMLLAVIGVVVALWWPITLSDGQRVDEALMELVAPADPGTADADLVVMPDPAKGGDDKGDDDDAADKIEEEAAPAEASPE